MAEFEENDRESGASERDSTTGQNVELVHLRLRDMILRGELPTEVPLSQVQLAQQLGVSRTPLREALRLLQHEGLVVGEPRQRVHITGFSLVDLEQLYAARIALEALGIRLTIPRLTSSDLQALEQELSQIERYSMIEDYERWRVPHRAFHRGLVAHAGDRLVGLIAQLSDHSERYRRVYTLTTPGASALGTNELLRIFHPSVPRDPAAATLPIARHSHPPALTLHPLSPP